MQMVDKKFEAKVLAGDFNFNVSYYKQSLRVEIEELDKKLKKCGKNE